jgi:sugar/nucleoside kinase (ribokinase family)
MIQIPPESLRIHGLGTVVVDHHVLVEQHPQADTKCEILSDHHQVGGPVPTALSLLRRFGAKTSFQGSWARDQFGEMIEQDLADSGIGFHPPKARPNARSGFAHVWVEKPTGRRTIAAFRGSHPVDEEDLHHAPLGQCNALHLDGWSTPAAIAAARSVKARGGHVFMDLGSPKPDLESLLATVDVLNCPARLARQLLGHSELEVGARQLLGLGPSEVTITLGHEGALHGSREGVTHSPAFPIRALDTNGAGDVFTGAFIFATLQKWPAARKLRFACAASAIKCRAIGNRAALPTLEAIFRLMSTMPDDSA